MKDRIYEPNPKVVVSCRPPSSLWRRRSTEKFQSHQKWLLPHHKAKYHVEYMLYIFLYFTGEQNWPNIARWNRITLDLSYSRDSLRIKPFRSSLRDVNERRLYSQATVAMAEYFRGPRNSITTALHYGKCQWVFNIFHVFLINVPYLFFLSLLFVLLVCLPHMCSFLPYLCSLSVFRIRAPYL